jgi:hypothetical protein
MLFENSVDLQVALFCLFHCESLHCWLGEVQTELYCEFWITDIELMLQSWCMMPYSLVERY